MDAPFCLTNHRILERKGFCQTLLATRRATRFPVLIQNSWQNVLFPEKTKNQKFLFNFHVATKMLVRRLFQSISSPSLRLLTAQCSTSSANKAKTVDELEFEDFQEVIDEVQQKTRDEVSFSLVF